MRRTSAVSRSRLAARVAVVLASAVLVACDTDDPVGLPSAPVTTFPESTSLVESTAVGAPTRSGLPDTERTDVPTTTPATSAAHPLETQPGTTLDGERRFEHPAGLLVTYPAAWSEAGPVIATEYSADAVCGSVQIVDFEPPTDPDTAEAGFVRRSVVQICAQPADGQDLEEFMSATYGGTTDFGLVDLGGVPAYRTGDEFETVFFVQHGGALFQVLTSVVADPTLERQRLDEVEQILQSVSFD